MRVGDELFPQNVGIFNNPYLGGIVKNGTFDGHWVMSASLGIDNTLACDRKSVDKQLADLYSRRSAVESLIRCLESYAECQAKNERRERLETA
jgi:hypothetical protein